MSTLTSIIAMPSLTPNDVTAIPCTLLTLARLTVTAVVPLPLVLLIVATPAVTAALCAQRKMKAARRTEGRPYSSGINGGG